MKGYICAILLLMCGNFATQVRGACVFGNYLVPLGLHTLYPCMPLTCDARGRITFGSCPKGGCDPGMDIIEWKPETQEKFPECCRRPICHKKGEPYALPLKLQSS